MMPGSNTLVPAGQQQDRRKFLGASDAAAVVGLSPWKTPVELWMEKTGRTPATEPDRQQRRRFERGHRLEPFICDMTVDKLRDEGMEVELVARNERYVDADHPFLSCEIDFELVVTGELAINNQVVVFNREHINADAKSVTGFARKKWGEERSEDVPIEYACQFMTGLGITGRGYTLVAALRSFDDVDIYWTIRDDETIASMRAKMVDFWVNHVVADVPPDAWKFTDIKALYPVDTGGTVEATPQIAAAAAELAAVKRRMRIDEKTEETLALQIGDFMRPNSTLTYDGKTLLTWKAQNDTRLDQKALKEERPDVFDDYARTKVIRVMRLKV